MRLPTRAEVAARLDEIQDKTTTRNLTVEDVMVAFDEFRRALRLARRHGLPTVVTYRRHTVPNSYRGYLPTTTELYVTHDQGETHWYLSRIHAPRQSHGGFASATKIRDPGHTSTTTFRRHAGWIHYGEKA
jgi:hypothetical protein